MEEFTALIAWAAQALAAWRQANPILAEGVSFACRLLAPMLTLLILVRTIRSLLTVPAQPEVWAVLGLPNGVKVPLTRWENIMGRSPSADVVVNYPSVSRQHAAIIRRGDDADWTVYDLGSKMGTSVNGQPVEGSAPVTVGDTVELGGVPMVLIPVDDKELSEQVARRRRPGAHLPLATPHCADGAPGAVRVSAVYGGRGGGIPQHCSQFSGSAGDDVAVFSSHARHRAGRV